MQRWTLHLALALAPLAFGADGLNLADPESLCTAQSRFLKRFPRVLPEQQAPTQFALWSFYDQAVKANDSTMLSLGADLPPGGEQRVLEALRERDFTKSAVRLRSGFPEVFKRMDPWQRCGFRLRASWDNDIYLDSDPWFLQALEDHLPPSLRAYVDLFLIGNTSDLDYDGAVALRGTGCAPASGAGRGSAPSMRTPPDWPRIWITRSGSCSASISAARARTRSSGTPTASCMTTSANPTSCF